MTTAMTVSSKTMADFNNSSDNNLTITSGKTSKSNIQQKRWKRDKKKNHYSDNNYDYTGDGNQHAATAH